LRFTTTISDCGNNLHDEYENYSWKVMKDGEQQGIEDPKKPNYAISAARHGLSMLASAGTMYDPHQKEREQLQVTITRRKQQKMGGNKTFYSTKVTT
jgi:hypothetical protein